ncbi:hypothetical protein SAMN05216483_0039 [Streptomyces sp. 2131.1]|nr:hypothetical protein SAMN05216483_0039 [Streptomyces sp. 2131.1]
MSRPTSCSYQIPGSWGAVAICDHSNGGHYRALVICKDSKGNLYNYVGGWRTDGYSYAYCQGESKASSAGIETKVS